MIDYQTETLIPIRDLGNSVPSKRGGSKIHIATIYRWCSIGLRGVRLETLKIGGARYTSKEALGKFFAHLSTAQKGSQKQARDERREPL